MQGKSSQDANAGSFTYTNLSSQAQYIGSLIVSVSNPSALSALTAVVTQTGASASTNEIAPSTTLTFSPPITITEGAAVTFSFTATVAGGAAMNTRPFAYASMLAGGASPTGRLSGGMLLVGVMLMPLGIRQRRRVALVALVGVLLMVTAAGCGGGSSSAGQSGQSTVVDSGGNPKKSIVLSTIKSSVGNSTQQLVAVAFE